VGANVPHAELIPEVDKEYLIKWKRKSYFRVVWMRGDWVFCVSNPTTRRSFYLSDNALKPTPTTEEAVSEDKLRVDIVFEVTYLDNIAEKDKRNPEMVKEAFVKYKGLNYEDTVWEEPPKPTEERWADFKTAFEDWLARAEIQTPDRDTLKDHLAIVRTQDFQQNLLLHTQSDLITGGDLMEYQMDGVNWLYYMFVRQQNAILADDMGLGKTVQVIGLFASLIQSHACWPFLVCCPNATVPNWRREIKNWAPSIQVVTYFGTQYSRQMARDYEMFPRNGKNLHCHVVIASYESMLDDEAKRVLNKVPWAGLVVDEGQRLKNDKSQLYERLCRMEFGFKALLTGTPLQNNIRELFNLLQFLDREKNAEALEEEYSMLDSEKIRTLHDMIRPFFLRRTKAEVLPFLPPMVQIIVPVSMSLVQKKLYKSILGKNPQLIKAIVKKQAGQIRKQDRHNLNNILMQLRKCLCHPFIYNRAIEEYTNDAVLAQRHLVEASGKLRLLDLMLPKLRERGHRVLIFSQFLENLDVVEDFLSGLDLPYCRLDGKLAAREKQHQIDQFNAPDSPIFAFLLSTRSGGVGINLATADTVIIMDPDFNPKQDMQALSRAHRIGQQKTVLVFHLTTRASVEEKIMQKGKKKLALDHVLIERMEADEDEDNLESILQHGAAALFDEDDSGDIHYDSPSIDKLLDRSQIEKAEHVENNDSGSAEQPQFNFARVWQNDRGTLEEVADETEATSADVTAWEEILRRREREANEEAYRKAEGLGRGKRKRATVNYQTVREEEAGDHDIPDSSPVKPRNDHDPDVEFRQFEPENESTDDEDAAVDNLDIDLRPGTPPRSKTRPFKRVHLTSSASLDGTMDPRPSIQAGPSCLACGKLHQLGACPLKHAGVENCPLCGLAHFGKRRACPHLQSKTQTQRMLVALSKSKEDPELVNMAAKYLRSILTSEAHRERLKAAKAAMASSTANAFQPMKAPQQSTTTTAHRPGDAPVPIDLTGPDSPPAASNNIYQPPAPPSSVPTHTQLPPH
jgi:SNF2 family DNA or RNA helicase